MIKKLKLTILLSLLCIGFTLFNTSIITHAENELPGIGVTDKNASQN